MDINSTFLENFLEAEPAQKIESLAEYIVFTDSLYYPTLYRGENNYYDESCITATAHRANNYNIEINKRKYHNYKNLLNTFYKETAYHLSDMEKDNFTHYAQHHGLPTELIDVTENPLVAMFFACMDYKNEDKEDGYIYLFNKLQTLNSWNIEDMPNLLDMKKNPVIILSLFDKHSLSSQDFCLLIKNCIDKIREFAQRPSSKKHLSFAGISTLNMHLESVDTSAIPTIFQETSRILKKEIYTDLIEYSHKVKLDLDSNLESDPLFIYSFLIHKILTFEIQLLHNFTLNDYDDFNSNLFPPILTESSVNFDRINFQSGKFFYQICAEKQLQTSKDRLLQIIKPAKILYIPADSKSSIIDSLDKIGINRKTLFGDPDNIAKYLTDKSFH